MDETEWLAERFEQHRPRLRAVAYRMLSSLTEAEDAVQDAWIRLSRSKAEQIDNLGGWLTTVVARECLHMLRSRRRRQEVSFEGHLPDPVITPDGDLDPEHQALLADGIGLALLAVLDPDVVLRADPGAAGAPREVRGARAVAEQARAFSHLGQFSRRALVNGVAGIVSRAPGGPTFSVMGFAVARGKITEIDILADPERLRLLDLKFLDD